jgi:hypothetical protein
MWDIMPVGIKNLIDSIFAPLLQFLTLIVDMLDNAGTIVGAGINVNNYFSFFGYLPAEWQGVVKSAMASVVLLAILFLVRSFWDMYLKSKDSIQYW